MNLSHIHKWVLVHNPPKDAAVLAACAIFSHQCFHFAQLAIETFCEKLVSSLWLILLVQGHDAT